MLKTYLKTAIRAYSFRKKTSNRPFFTYINLFGLIIGLSAFLFIAHLVRYELSYDKSFTHSSSIYRVKVEKTENGETTMASAKTYPGVGNLLKSGLAEVQDYARVLAEECMMHYKKKDIKFNRQSTYWADKSFITMFGLSFIEKGDTSLLDKPNNCILSQSAAERYFGRDWKGENSPIGKTINLNESLLFTVQGVYKDLPANSHMEVDFIVSYATLIQEIGPGLHTGMPPFGNVNYTYISLRPGTSAKKTEALAQKILSENIPASASSGAKYQFSLQPLESIHLDSHLADELKPNGNKTFVIALALAAGLILLVGWINFINLATARAMHRAKEVGVRKAIGSTKKQLFSQFLVESLFTSVLAAIGAIIIVLVLSGYIKNLMGIKASVFSWRGDGLYYWLFFIFIIFAGGLLASIYPALVLSSFKAIDVLKGKLAGTHGKGFLRKSLISFQFFIAVFLLTCTGAIYYQVNYMRSQSLGINTDQVVVLHSPRSLIGSKKRIEYFKNFREELLRNPGIEQVGSSGCIPGDEFLNHWEGVRQLEKEDGKNLTYDVAWADEGYLPSLGFTMKAGSNFSDRPGEDTKVIPNETAIRALGFRNNNEAIGKIIKGRNGKQYEIIGVVNDAHYEGLQKNIRPLLLFFGHNYEFGYFSAKINAANIASTLSVIQNQWETIYPNDPFDYFFLDSFFDEQYRNDQRFGNVFGLFSFLAILIACLGLVGLVSFTTYQKVKEIGIRKVLGANIAGILGLLTGEFFKPILLACLVAIPVNHFIISKWLDTFATRFNFSWWMHLVPLLLINLLALLAIIWQSLKAATANPVKALREI
jgi:putative ABC transport system permease protein